MSRKEKEKAVRRQAILDAAALVFAKYGYENASMNEIAKLSEFTKRTLYQYFEDKADLYLSVLIQRYSLLVSALLDTDCNGMSGIEALRHSLYTYYECFQKRPDTFRIMHDFGAVRGMTNNPQLRTFLDIDAQTTQFIIRLIEQGQADGTVTAKQDATTTSIHIKFLVSAVFDELIMVGSAYAKHIGKTEDEFAHSLFEMIVSMLKS